MLSFNRFGKKYIVDKGDKFMDNFTGTIQFLPIDSDKIKTKRKGLFTWKDTVSPAKSDWGRIKPLLTKKSFEGFDLYTY